MDKITRFRRDLHEIPETGLKEFKTQSYLKTELEKMGYSPITIASTGLYVYVDYNCEETIAFRSDIDGLPITENNEITFKSKHEGYMHACGHDGHMSMLLGFADYLSQKDDLNRNVLLIFQPAEENPGGAKTIVETGIFRKYNVKEIYGIHLFPNFLEGTIITRKNAFMGSVTNLDIEIHGESAHAAMKGEGIDALYFASKYYTDLVKAVDNLNLEENYILKIGKMYSGSVRNIVSNYTKLEGTMRTLSDKTRELITKQMYDLKDLYEKKYGLRIVINDVFMYPTVTNDSNLVDNLKTVLTEYEFVELEEPLMISEDFSFYQKEVKGVFYFLGTKNTELGYTYLLHNDRFNFDEKVLYKGIDTYIKLINSY